MTTATTVAPEISQAMAGIIGIDGKLFPNSKEDVTVNIGKDKKVPAALSYFVKEGDKPYSLRVTPEITAANGRKYYKAVLVTGLGDQRKYYDGLLNVVKKEGSEFAFAGSLDVEGSRTIKVMVRKPAAGKTYYTVKFSKEKTENSVASTAPAELAPAQNEQAEGFPA
jgi:hypothetical protein